MDNVNIENKSLGILTNSFEKVGITISDKLKKSIEDNGISAIKDFMVESITTNKHTFEETLKLSSTLVNIEKNLLKKRPYTRRGNEVNNGDVKRAELKKEDLDAAKFKQEKTSAEHLEKLSSESTTEAHKQTSILEVVSNSLKNILKANLLNTGFNSGTGKLLGGLGGSIGGLSKGLGKGLLKAGVIAGGVLAVGQGVSEGISTMNNKKFADNSKTSAFAAGFLTGGEDSSTLDNAAKFAGIGSAIGSFIPGVGSIIGGVIGAATGALLSLLDTKQLADTFDKIGSKFKHFFTSDYWIGRNGVLTNIFTSIRESGKKMQNLGRRMKSYLVDNLINPVKDFSLYIKDLVITPFTKEFWSDIGVWISDKWTSITTSAKEKFGDTYTSILETLTKPFTKEFWTGLLSSMRKKWEKLGKDLSDYMSRLVNSFRDYIADSILEIVSGLGTLNPIRLLGEKAAATIRSEKTTIQTKPSKSVLAKERADMAIEYADEKEKRRKSAEMNNSTVNAVDNSTRTNTVVNNNNYNANDPNSYGFGYATAF